MGLWALLGLQVWQVQSKFLASDSPCGDWIDDYRDLEQIAEVVDSWGPRALEALTDADAASSAHGEGATAHSFEKFRRTDRRFGLALALRARLEELGTEGEDGLFLHRLKALDVHDKIGFPPTVLDVMPNRPRAPSFLGNAGHRVGGCDAAEAAQEAGAGDELGAPAVIGVAIVEGVGEDDIGPKTAQHLNDLQKGRLIHFEEAIGETEVFTVGQAEDFGGTSGLYTAQLRRTAGAEFATS